MNTMHNAPRFEAAEKNELIVSESRQMEYLAYRAQYRKQFGVLPELDKIHHPVTAVPMNNVFWPTQSTAALSKNMLKSFGSLCGGALKLGGGLLSPGSGILTEGFQDVHAAISDSSVLNPELKAEFTRRFKALIEPVQAAYGLLFDDDLLPDLTALEEGMHVTDGLGYCWNGETYLEGTWRGNDLIYGLAYFPDGRIFIGDLSGDDWYGVTIKDRTIDVGSCDDNGLHCEEGLRLDLNQGYAFLGAFRSDCSHGMTIVLDINSGAVLKQNYKDGLPEKGLSGFLKRQMGRLDTHKNTFGAIVGRFSK